MEITLTHKALSIVSLLALNFTAFNAFAIGTERISTGDVIVAYPDEAEQETLQSPRDDLFTTREQRQKVKPMRWNEEVLPSFYIEKNGVIPGNDSGDPGNDSGEVEEQNSVESESQNLRQNWRHQLPGLGRSRPFQTNSSI